MLSAAVRDLHRWYPGRFITDVRTRCPELWENNPHVTPLVDDDPAVEQVECFYPLINKCNDIPYHCLHGFIEFLNERLQLAIRPTAFKGDIHLSRQEKLWHSQVREITGEETPFWIVTAGGKHDVTVKWWQTERFQQVIDHFRGRIQFVQVGEIGHWHPKLRGAIDLRGQTSLRELVRLVYHAQGVLCPVTALMHLAAAVETPPGHAPNRPCVVIAGGREPAHWEAYPDHQFIHTNGALPCCAGGGCWKDRTVRLRDGDERDGTAHLCVNVAGELPRCMDLITPEEVVRRIETYFDGGILRYLPPSRRPAAERGVAATAVNRYDRQPLNIHFAGMACDQFIRTIPDLPQGPAAGRGIVICGGGPELFTGAWVCIRMLRRFGCRLPIQLWHLKEVSPQMKALIAPFGVECVDARRLQKTFPVRYLHQPQLKCYAILHCRFREVMWMDTMSVPVADPEFLFDTPQFKATGAMFWEGGVNAGEKWKAIYRSCGLRAPGGAGFASGPILLDKQRCRPALRLALWFNEHSDFYHDYVPGEDTFRLAFHKFGRRYSVAPRPGRRPEERSWQHDFMGRRIFKRRGGGHWDLFLRNRSENDIWFEKECRGYVEQLRRAWNGGMKPEVRKRLNSARAAAPLKIETVMISCAPRNELRRRTLKSLARTDWGEMPLIQFDDGEVEDPVERQLRSTYSVLKRGIESAPDYILFLEDDLLFNRNLRHNILNWSPVKARMVTLASLYNPRVRELACDIHHNARIACPGSVFGSQAFLMSRKTVEFLLRNWDKEEFGQDIRISRLAARLKHPIFYHAPSLVQHVGARSVWGGRFHQAIDFDPSWKA